MKDRLADGKEKRVHKEETTTALSGEQLKSSSNGTPPDSGVCNLKARELPLHWQDFTSSDGFGVRFLQWPAGCHLPILGRHNIPEIHETF